MERSGAAKRLRSGPWKGSGHHEGCKGNSHERIRGGLFTNACRSPVLVSSEK